VNRREERTTRVMVIAIFSVLFTIIGAVVWNDPIRTPVDYGAGALYALVVFAFLYFLFGRAE
jgi:polyferredoxin